MKRGFTLVELMFASAIALIVMAAMVVYFGGIWRMMKESNDELQLSLHARAVRERILYRLDATHGGLFYAKFLGAAANSLRVKVERFSPGETAKAGNASADATVPLDPEQIEFPGDYGSFGESVKPRSSEQLCDNVYPAHFLENEASATPTNNLIRLNLHHPSDAKRSLVYEDHVIVFLDAKEVGQL